MLINILNFHQKIKFFNAFTSLIDIDKFPSHFTNNTENNFITEILKEKINFTRLIELYSFHGMRETFLRP